MRVITENDLYRGKDIKLTDHITIYHPTVGEVFDDEIKYMSTVFTICATPTDLAWQLEEYFNIDFVTADDYEVFANFIAPSLDIQRTRMLFGSNLDFSKMRLEKIEGTDEIVLKQHVIKQKEIADTDQLQKFRLKNNIVKSKTVTEEYDIIFDRYTYMRITDFLRKLFNIKKNGDKPGNKGARKYLISQSKEKFENSKNNTDDKSNLLNLISTMVNSEGFKHDEVTVFDMKYSPFMDSVKRINKIFHTKVLYQSGYSGFGIDLSKLNKETELNMMSDLD